ncbi:DUF1822 family protein [Fischerella sp. JS2]|uniref:DUF1822 family protein n=1 Tax=Fischerella sp. JS2 TaxID=2597771 RepID=UPI0037C11A2D
MRSHKSRNSSQVSIPTKLGFSVGLYLNKLCLSAVLLWLQEDFAPQAKLWTTTTGLPSF